MKHTRQDLNIMQGWSLEEKIKVSQMKILEWYRAYSGQVFTSFSGGKDSTVLLDLARQVCPDIPAVYVDTAGIPRTARFCKNERQCDLASPTLSVYADH